MTGFLRFEKTLAGDQPRCCRIVTRGLPAHYVLFLNWGLGSYTEVTVGPSAGRGRKRGSRAESTAEAPDGVSALLAVELVCVETWVLTGGI